MAVKIRLVKGPMLRRIIVLVLLSLTGLGHPPNICEAIKCHCAGVRSCKGDTEIDCEARQLGKGCNLLKGNGGIYQGCDADGWYGSGEAVFKCVQQKVGGSGNCVEGDYSKLTSTQKECKQEINGGPGSGGVRSHSWNDTIEGRNPSGHLQICTCRTDLCNSDAGALAGGGGGDGVGGGSGVDRVVITGRNVFQAGISGLIIILLTTNGLIF